MVGWIIQTALLSLLCIVLLHQGILWVMQLVTVPKVIDMVHAPQEQYRRIYDELTTPSSPKPQKMVSFQEANPIQVVPEPEYIETSSIQYDTFPMPEEEHVEQTNPLAALHVKELQPLFELKPYDTL